MARILHQKRSGLGKVGLYYPLARPTEEITFRVLCTDVHVSLLSSSMI
jgi:hypothetical protein